MPDLPAEVLGGVEEGVVGRGQLHPIGDVLGGGQVTVHPCDGLVQGPDLRPHLGRDRRRPRKVGGSDGFARAMEGRDAGFEVWERVPEEDQGDERGPNHPYEVQNPSKAAS